MLDQLVESKSNTKENTRRTEFMLITAVIAVTAVLTFWTYDLYGHPFGMGGDDLELSTLVAPPPPEDEPPPPKPKEPEKQQPDVDVRKELIQNIMSSPVKPPDTTSVDQNKVKQMRLNTLTKLGGENSDTGADVGRNARVVTDGGTGGLSTGSGDDKSGAEQAAPPPPP